MDRITLSALVLAVGIASGGFFAGSGFARGRAADRYVEVKGVAERDVKADLALWPLRLMAAGNDLGATQAEIARHTTRVYAFLQRHGLDTTQIEIQGNEVSDALANQYAGDRQIRARYVVSQTLMIRSANVDLVLAASAKVGDLIGSGVVLSSDRGGYGASGPTFLFTRLNDLKPGMIREATGKAREAAEQFAGDSRSGLAGIRQANQGVFVILARDQANGVGEQSQVFKTVRVVSTVQYYLRG